MRSNIKRIYPVRTTKRRWSIPIYCYHHCNFTCSLDIRINMENSQVLINSRERRCTQANKLEKGHVRLSDFDKNNPRCILGELYNPNMRVTPPGIIILSLNYPLSCIIDVLIYAENQGFTLREIIQCIKLIYKFIYEEEERTSPPQQFNITQICECQSNSRENLREYIEPVSPEMLEKKEQTCCICYLPYTENNQGGKLHCGHIFHEECIITWFENSITCPLCRRLIFNCTQCNSTGVIIHNYEGIVIPVDQRRIPFLRNRTYGIYGIHSTDYEHLVLSEIKFDNKKKRLYINVS